MRRFGLAGLAIIGAAGVFAFAPPGLDCADPVYRSDSPDGSHRLAVCRQDGGAGMPGSGSDAPGLIVIHDARRYIVGVSSLSMVQLAEPVEWAPGRVTMKLATEIALSAPEPSWRAWLSDRVWRWRALLGFVPSDEDFR